MCDILAPQKTLICHDKARRYPPRRWSEKPTVETLKWGRGDEISVCRFGPKTSVMDEVSKDPVEGNPRNWSREVHDAGQATETYQNKAFTKLAVVNTTEMRTAATKKAAVERVMRDLEEQNVYMGEVKDGYPHGYGVAIWRECVVYEGKWTHGRCREQRGALRGTKNVTLFALFQKAERALSCEWRATCVAGCVRPAACNLFVFLPCNLFFFFAVALANRQDIFGLECQKVDGAGAGGVTTVSFTGDDLSPFVDSVGEMLEKNLRPNSDDIAIQPERDTTGEWFDCDELFEDFWVTCFHTEPYYGDTKGKLKANSKPRYNTVACGRKVIPAGVGPLSGRYLDPCPLLHDVGAWGNLEDFLVVCGAVEMKWQQGGESWLEPGKHGTMLVRFESDGTKCVCIVWCLCVPFVPTSTYIVLQKVRSSFRVVARGVRLVRPMVPGACGPGQEDAEQKLRAEPVRLQLRRVRPGQGAPARGACVHVQRPRERRREEVRSRFGRGRCWVHT